MKKIGITALFFLLLGCQTMRPDAKAPVSSSAEILQNAEDELGSGAPDLLKEHFRKQNQSASGDLSRSLFAALKKANLTKGKELILSDLICQITAEKDEVVSKCSFQKKRKGNWQPGSLRGELAEELRLELSRFPVPQGDSGVSVSYLRCQSEVSPESCELALDLGYSGP